MKYRIFFSIALCFISLNIKAENSTKQDDEARKEIIDEGFAVCKTKKFKTVGEREACHDVYFEKARQLYPRRGTNAYSKKHYGGISKAEAKVKLLKLQSEYEESEKKGEIYCRACSKRPAGYVAQEEIIDEGWWIQKNILGARSLNVGLPFFIECDDGHSPTGHVKVCPLGEEESK